VRREADSRPPGRKKQPSGEESYRLAFFAVFFVDFFFAVFLAVFLAAIVDGSSV
jgi:hypothetical protein